MSLFGEKTETKDSEIKDFSYLKPGNLYFDSACQTLRPDPVIAAEIAYYREFNACGGRVKYEWGQQVDEKINSAKGKLLKLLKVDSKTYAVAFTLNTTFGLNLVLSQLPNRFAKVITSEIEHNSVFLPTILLAKRLGIERLVLPRTDEGDLVLGNTDTDKAVFVLNVTSNIDGRTLNNLKAIISDARAKSGLVILDAAQTMAHNLPLIQGVDFDALCGSVHKMYGQSLGFVVIKKALLEELDYTFLGGGTVSDVRKDNFDLLEGPDISARLESGLQNFAGIVGFGADLDWFISYKPEGLEHQEHQKQLSELAYSKLSSVPSVHLTRAGASPIISLYSDRVDSNRLALYLSQQKVMVRSGYFCCHYYLREIKNYPPLLRFSIGAYNTNEQVDKATDMISRIINNA